MQCTAAHVTLVTLSLREGDLAVSFAAYVDELGLAMAQDVQPIEPLMVWQPEFELNQSHTYRQTRLWLGGEAVSLPSRPTPAFILSLPWLRRCWNGDPCPLRPLPQRLRADFWPQTVLALSPGAVAAALRLAPAAPWWPLSSGEHPSRADSRMLTAHDWQPSTSPCVLACRSISTATWRNKRPSSHTLTRPSCAPSW